VLIDIPKDVTTGKLNFVWPESIKLRSYNPTYEGNKFMITQAAHMIAKARKPLIIAGGGVNPVGRFKGIEGTR